jgi:hypothetical protein
MPLYIGGGSDSSANQTTTTETQDNRIAAAPDSTSINNSRGNIQAGNNINLTDDGAVGRSFDFAQSIAEGAANMQAASAGQMATTVTNALGAVQAAYQDESKKISDAYETSKAGEQKILVAGALLIAGIVAIKSFGKGA